MKVLTRLFLFVAVAFYGNHLTAQTYKRIAVIGSSTAYGYGVPADSNWVNRVKAYYKNSGLIDTVYNIAVSGTDCYTGMPTGYVPPPGRNLPDPLRNITKALSFIPKPNVIIVNYPTNNYDWLTNEEILNCLQTIKNTANAQNVACYISTTQPRETFSMPERQKLKDLKGLISAQFGVFAIDFWTDVTLEPDLIIDPVSALGDFVHLNSHGHGILFQKVIERNIFATPIPLPVLPVTLIGFTGYNDNESIILIWSTSSEINSSHFVIERSNSNLDFQPIGKIEASINSNSIIRYNFRDLKPLNGQNFYRLAAIDKDKTSRYSPAITIYHSPSSFQLNVYPSPSRNQITVTLWSSQNSVMIIKIFNATGQQEFLSFKNLRSGQNSFSYPIEKFTNGLHFIKVQSGKEIITKNFIKE